MPLDYIYFFILMMSVVAALLVCFEKGVGLYIKLFFPHLLLTLCVETGARFLNYYRGDNRILYNYFLIFEFEFYLFVLYNIVSYLKAKKVIRFLLWAFPLIKLADMLVYGHHRFSYITYSVGAILILFFSSLYLYAFFRHTQKTNLFREPGFWITSGLMLFYGGTLPLFGAINLSSDLPDWLINYMGYYLFAISFLVTYKFNIFKRLK